MARFRFPRRFRFSLRTLFVVVTISCLFLGSQIHLIQMRKAHLEHIKAIGGFWIYESPYYPQVSVPRHRELFGDQAIQLIAFVGRCTEGEWLETAARFPEAKI